MFNVIAPPTRLCDGISRRELLRFGGLGAGGLSLAHLIGGTSHAATGPKAKSDSAASAPIAPRAKNCIVLMLMGGPPQQSTWDPKPSAPAEVRGEFAPISTPVPGMQISELLPKTALLAQHLCLLRAVSTGDNAHSSSGYYMMTGVPHAPMNRENANPGPPNNYPNFGAIVRALTPSDRSQLPAAVRLPSHIFNTDGSVWPGQDGGFLGRAADPWLFRCEPASPTFSIPEFTLPSDMTGPRLLDRRSLLSALNQHRQAADAGGLAQYDAATQQAFDLLTSPRARAAMRLDAETAKTRARYGATQFGQSALLSRRLIEAGVRLVQVNWFRGADEPSDSPCWDSHTHEAKRLRTALAPPFDQAFSALLVDLVDRRLLDETLVVCLSEFGRSPKINAQAGRDHWGNVFSLCLAGGGIRGGMVHGASDAVGGAPRDGLVRPADLLATMFHLLGHEPATQIHDHLGRPLPISRGEIVNAVCS
jgi:hypothetical protein